MGYNEVEKDKYNKAWDDKRYTGSDQSQLIAWMESQHIYLDELDFIVDFGCGKAHLREKFRAGGEYHYTEYIGIDIAEKALKRAHKTLRETDKLFCWPLDEFNFDAAESKRMRKHFTGFNTDVMEHIDAGHVDAVLKNMASHCKQCFFNIALFPHIFEGVDLHLSQLEPETWKLIISRYFDVEADFVITGRYYFVHAVKKTGK